MIKQPRFIVTVQNGAGDGWRASDIVEALESSYPFGIFSAEETEPEEVEE